MGEQAILPGFKRYLPAPKKDWRPWTDSKGQQVDVPRQSASFYGAVIPLPTDKKERLLEIGPFSVLQRTDGRYVVVQYADRSDKSAHVFGRYVAGRGQAGKREAVMEMWKLSKASCL